VSEVTLSTLEAQLPPLIPRHRIGQFLGGLYSPGYMANLDSKGHGPKDRVVIGKKCCYTRESLIEWLRERAQSAGSGGA